MHPRIFGRRPLTAVYVLGMLTAGLTASCYENTPATTGGAGGTGTTSSTTTTASGGSGGGTGGTGTALPGALEASTASTRFITADVMLASIEMQVSGEPFAELLGRDIAGYDRFSSQTDNYLDPETGMPTSDPLGFSLAIESYEYSKQSMNTLSFEASAGLSLQFGPVLNPTGATGDPAFTLMLDRLQYLGKASRASGATFGKDFVTSPPPPNDPTNYYGWPGIWPVFAEFRSFDPAFKPKEGADAQCSLAGATDEPLPPGTVVQFVGDYECDANTLALTDRDAQSEKVLAPDALARSAWKQTLWVMNYWAALHDVGQRPIIVVPEAALDQVGEPGNLVVGQWESPVEPGKLLFGKQGTYFGGVSLEGWQGLLMMDEMDNKSEFILKSLTTADGTTLSPVASVAAAVDYDYNAPLRWFPAAVGVTEMATHSKPEEAKKYFPKPTAFKIDDKTSRLQDLAALAAGFGAVFAITDENNPENGGSQQFRAAFDGKPWAADNGQPDGESSLHDRSLGIIKIALVNLDRIHFDKANSVLVDTATPGAGGTVTRGTIVSTSHAAQAIVELRTALRALDASLTLYSNDTPDTLGVSGQLDLTQLDGKPFSGTLSERVREIIKQEADFISNKLLDANGAAADSYDLSKNAADSKPASLEAQAAAVRGLLEAYLATSDVSYRQRAEQAYKVLESKFWMDDVKIYRSTAGESMKMTFSPRQFGILHGALRQYYKLVASSPGHEDEATALLARIVRMMKLVVNGWDDTNGDGVVQPTECLGGRLQMAERALTGENSVAADMGDRDHDCVKDIAAVGLPAGLAAEIVFQRK